VGQKSRGGEGSKEVTGWEGACGQLLAMMAAKGREGCQGAGDGVWQ